MASSSAKDNSGFDIRKFDGSNFGLWKEQIQDILVQKKQRAPIAFATRQAALTEHFQVTQFEWEELDAMARSTIRLHLAESVYFTVLDCPTVHATWLKLCNTYEQNTPSNKVFLMQKLFNLRIKENGSVAHHINDFESTFAQMRAQRMNLDDELKAIFLLCSLPASWDTFCTAAVSNSAPNGNLVYGNITGALLSEESRRKTMGSSHHGEAHYVQKEGKQRQGRSKQHNESNKDGKKDASPGLSKSHGKKDIQCHFCDKFGHLKKDCYAWKREKGKSKSRAIVVRQRIIHKF